MRTTWLCAALLALWALAAPAVARAQDDADLQAPDGADGDADADVAPEPEPEPEPAVEPAPVPAAAAPAPAPEPPLTDAPRAHGGEDESELHVRQTVLPPWFDRQQGDERMRALFPFYFSTNSPRVSTLLIPPYYQRRDRRGWNTDILFPFVWSYRRPDPQGSLLVIPPFYTNTADNGWDLGLAPLAFAGRTDDSHYVVIPPLLFWSFWDDDSSFTLAGPLYIRNTPTSKAWGLPPLLFFGESEGSTYRVALPLYYHFSNDDEGTGTTVVGPFYNQYGPGWSSVGLFPLVNVASGQTWTKATVLPLFHYSRRGDDRLTLITPLFGYDTTATSSTLITPLYQRVRGATNLDAVAPLFWSWRRPRIGSESLLIGPWLHQTDPASRTDVVFPFIWDFDTPGVSRTTAVAPLFLYSQSREEHSTSLWIAPTIQYASDNEGWAFNVHPLLYTGASAHSPRNHQVLFPFFYRFEDEDGPDTVVFPFVWDFHDRPTHGHDLVLFPFFWGFQSAHSYTQVVLNTVYQQGRCARGGKSWRFDFIPLFAFGAPCPGDVYWSVLYGLVGYRTAGQYRKMELFWLPFELSPSGTRPNEPQVAFTRN